jgi:hypothetical protein
LNRKRTISKMNPFTIPLRCLQRNVSTARARAFWPSVCGAHHRAFGAALPGILANNFREKPLNP